MVCIPASNFHLRGGGTLSFAYLKNLPNGPRVANVRCFKCDYFASPFLLQQVVLLPDWKTAAGQNISIQYEGQVCWRITGITVPPFCVVFFYLFAWFEYSSVKLKCIEREVERAKYSKLIICSLIRSSYFRIKRKLIVELLGAKGGRVEPHTLENLATHWSRKFWFSRNCPYIRKSIHFSRQPWGQDNCWPVTRDFIAGSGCYSGRQGGSTCNCKIWAQINLWRGVDLKNEYGLAWSVLLSTRILVITVVKIS